MSILRKLSGLIEKFTTIAAPRPVYATMPANYPRQNLTLELNHASPRKAKINYLDINEFKTLSHIEQDEIIDFIRFRYQARISDANYKNASLETIMTDLSRNLEVPVGKNYKHLTKELISRFIF